MIENLKKYFKDEKHFWNAGKGLNECVNKFKVKKSNKVSIEHTIENGKLKCTIIISDSSLYGKNARLSLISKVNVKDSRYIDNEKVLHKVNFKISLGSNNIIIIDLKNHKNFSYEGNMININLFTELKIDDSLLFDTSINKKIQNSLFVKPAVKKPNSAKSIINPKDNFNLIDNIKAIPADAILAVFGLSIIGGIIILINTIVGVHDQFVGETSTYFYSHYNSDGESNSPLVNSIFLSGALGVAVWQMMKTQLKKYMKFALRKMKFIESINHTYNVKNIVRGKSIVDLKNVELRIVACNMEKGQYVRGSGTNSRTVSFAEPIRALTIYKKKIAFIPKKTDIREYLSGEFSFEEMYKTLYPEQKISETHGLFVHWEIQLLHNRFIDQELIGDFSYFKYEYFLQG